MRAIDRGYLLKHKRKVRFFGIGPDDESWGYAVPAEVIENAPTLTLPNEPLTLEELREMDGEPVYIVIDGMEPLKMWGLIEIDGEDIYLTNNLGGRSAYAEVKQLYKVKLYRRPPEKEEENNGF